MLTRKLVTNILVPVAMLPISSIAMAEFSTYSNDWPDNQAVVNEKSPVAKKVVKETPLDKYCKLAPTKPRAPEIGCLYVKFGGYQGSTQIRHVRNQSSGQYANLLPAVYSVNQVGWDWDMGAGTAINDKIRFEIEYVHHKKINYNPAPMLIGNTAVMSSTVASQIVLLDMFVDFNRLNYFRPYFGLSGGLAWNQTRASVSGGTFGNGAYKDTDHYSFVWALTAGARVPFWHRFFAYVGYRYLNAGKAIWHDNTQIIKLQGQLVFQGFDFGVQMLVN